MLFWIAIAMTIVANVFYILCSKVTAAVNPLVALVVTYTVALIACLVLYPLISKEPHFFAEVRKVNWASIVLGFALVLLETGFILAFRSGWHVSSAALFSNVAVTVLLIPIAAVIFGDAVSASKILGMILAVCGLFLMVR